MALFIYYLQHDSRMSAAEKLHCEMLTALKEVVGFFAFLNSKFHDKEELK